MQKKLLLLGGSSYLLPVIKKAHELGLYVITCDYLPNNIAHKYSDEYFNISIIEKDEVLAAAKEKDVSGVMSFACDPGVVTAAYVAEKMSLPFQCSYQAAEILQNKGQFRLFLLENGFNSPNARSFRAGESPLSDMDYFHWPVIVKPVDSAGSKGVTKIETPQELNLAIEKALEASLSGQYIIEDFIESESCHTTADVFIVNGRLSPVFYADHIFDKAADNPYVPIASILPSMMEAKHSDYLTGELQRLVDLLHLRTGIYNIETMVGKGDIPYIMEVSPRGGGNYVSSFQEYAVGARFLENEVRKAVGLPLIEINTHPIVGAWCEMVIYSQVEEEGIFERLSIDSKIERENLRFVNLQVKAGDRIYPLRGANCALGHMFLQFRSRDELMKAISNTNEWLNIVYR